MQQVLTEGEIVAELEVFGDKELYKFFDNCESVIKNKRKAILTKAMNKIQAIVDGFELDDVDVIEQFVHWRETGVVDERIGAIKPKYINPNTGETWSGRGKLPIWLQEFVDKGADKEEFLIREV